MNSLHKLAVGLLLTLSLAARADSGEERRNEIKQAFAAGAKVLVRGPSEVALGGQAHVKLPTGMGWIPQPEAGRMMSAMGNATDKRLLGLVQPLSDETWVVIAEY